MLLQSLPYQLWSDIIGFLQINPNIWRKKWFWESNTKVNKKVELLLRLLSWAQNQTRWMSIKGIETIAIFYQIKNMKTLLKFFQVALEISIYERKTNWEDQISFENVEMKKINLSTKGWGSHLIENVGRLKTSKTKGQSNKFRGLLSLLAADCRLSLLFRLTFDKLYFL